MESIREAARTAFAGAAVLGERWRTGVAYNPLSDRTAQDPYPVYAALRERDPVHRSRLMNAWMFARHADVDAILRDHRNFGSDPRKGTLTARQQAMLPAPDELTMLLLDPPDHRRLRALVNKAFTPRAVEALEPRIRETLAALLDDIDDPERLRSHAGGGPSPAGDRDRRDAGRAARGPGPVRGLVGAARPPAGAHRQPARAGGGGGRHRRVRRLLPGDHRGAPRRARGRHIERAGPGRGRGRAAQRARDAQHAAPPPDRRQRDHDQPDRQRDAGAPAQPRTSSGGSGRTPA